MKTVQTQTREVAFGVKRKPAVELQRVGIIDVQLAESKRTAMRGSVKIQLHRLRRQFRVNRPQQQLATAKAGIQIELCRTGGGI